MSTTIFIPEINIWTPPYEWPSWMRRRRDETIVATAIHGADPGGAGNVTLSGEDATDNIAINRNARAAIVVRADGTVDRIENVTTTQVDVGTDWIDPPGDASSDYDVRYTGLTGDPLDGSTTLAEDVWGNMGADKFFEQRATSDGEDFESQFTLEIRFQGGAALDTGAYTCEAQRTDI